MARVFERSTVNAAPEQDEAAAGGRSTIRLLAAAVTALFVSFLVVTRSQGAMQAPGARVQSDITAGGVNVTDDDAGRSLFQVPAMAPGRPVANCIAVTYSGTVIPAVVRLSAQADGRLAGGLNVTVEEGDGGAFGDCGGFRPTRSVFTGTLAALAGRGPIQAFKSTSPTDTHVFRFTFTLNDASAAQGSTASTEFSWAASAS